MNSNNDNELCFRPDKSLMCFGVLVICIFGIIQIYLVIENEAPLAIAFSLATVAGIWFIGMWARFHLVLGSQSIRQHGLFTSEEVPWEDVQSVSWHDTRYVVLRHSHGELTIVFARFGKISRSPIIEYIKRNEQNLRRERLELVSKKQRSKPVLVLLFLVLISMPYAFFVRSSPNEARLLWGTVAFVPYWIALFFVGWKRTCGRNRNIMQSWAIKASIAHSTKTWELTLQPYRKLSSLHRTMSVGEGRI